MATYRNVPGLRYWKPVQTGDDDDRGTVATLAGLNDAQWLPNLYHFPEPLSPHRAAELAQAEVDFEKLVHTLGEHARGGPLLIEGAGGLYVPLNRRTTWLDFLQRTQLPVVIATRTALGTINHSLLTATAMQAAGVRVLGFIFCGTANADNQRTICDFTNLPAIAQFEYAPGEPLPATVDLQGLLAECFRV